MKTLVLPNILLAIVAWTLSGCDQRQPFAALVSPAKGKVSQLAGVEHAGLINDAPDFGYRVSFSVENVAKSGVIKVTCWLSSSEGEWTREQNLPFDKGAIEALSYFFHEPSINATNVRFGVKVLPSVD